jgi:membrane-associated phospholipid phosphatase
MPSLHVGWAVWCGAAIALYARHRWVQVLGIAYPIVTTVVVMATGNHYLLDAVAGAVVIAAGGWLSGFVPARYRTVPMGPGQTVIDGVTREQLEQAAARVEQAATERAVDDWDAAAEAEAQRYCATQR